MSSDRKDDGTGRRVFVTGLLALLGVGLVALGAMQGDTVAIAVGGGGLVVALATYSATA